MKIAVCSEGNDLAAKVDNRFGRTSFFLVIDTDSLDFEVISNTENQNGAHGSGIGAVELIAGLGAEAVLAPELGPAAAGALRIASIPAYAAGGLTVADAVSAFKRGELTRLDA